MRSAKIGINTVYGRPAKLTTASNCTMARIGIVPPT
jgi:hypothetical protein